MFSLVRTRLCSRLSTPLSVSKRLLATETTLPGEPSREFLDEERRRFGPKKEEPESDQLQQERYDAFLKEKASQNPKRPQLRVEVDPNHGLWAFFRQVEKDGKRTYETIEENRLGKTTGSGRAWKASELRRKSFRDLHTLWYIILRERNLLATQKAEAVRLGVRPDLLAGIDKDRRCRKSMARIKQVINERRLAYENAIELQRDSVRPEENGRLSAEGQATVSLNRAKGSLGPASLITEAEVLKTRGRRRPAAAARYRANAFRDLPAEDVEERQIIDVATNTVETPRPSL